MKTIHIAQNDKSQLFIEENLTHQNTAKENIPKRFRTLPQIKECKPHYEDPQYHRDPYSDFEIYDQEKLEVKQCSDRSPEQIEDDDIFTDSHVSAKPRYAS